MANKDVHVSKCNKGWKVQTSNTDRAAGYYPTQKDAANRAKEIASNKGSDVVVHGLKGKIVSKDSYGNDPCPPRDKEH